MSDDLIHRLESATEGSRELSDEVLLALGWKKNIEYWEGRVGPVAIWTEPEWWPADYPQHPDPTRNLQDAVDLVPEGWFWRVGRSTLYEGWASLNRLHPEHCNPEDEAFAKAATPALALSAAILRARKEEG